MPRLFRADLLPSPLPPPPDDHCAHERKLSCGRALPWYQLAPNDWTEAISAPAIRAVGGREVERRGPSSDGSRQVIAVKTRGFPGAGSLQAHDSAETRLSGFARQGLQREELMPEIRPCKG